MKFSIVTITYNRASLIGDTIQSVLNQTYKNFEYIIIDDGSTDNTEEIVNSFNDKRIKYFKQSKKDTLSILRNNGVNNSTGDVICVLDSDDLWKKNKLSILFNIFKNSEIQFVFHNATNLSEDNIEKDTIYSYKKDFYKNILNEILDNSILPYPFYSFKRSLVKKGKVYDESMMDGQHDFFLRTASKYPMYYCSKTLALKRHHKQMISKNLSAFPLLNLNITLKKLLRSNKINIQQYCTYLNKSNYKIARYYSNKNNTKEAIKYLTKIIKSDVSLLNLIYIKSFIRRLIIFK